MSIVKLQDTGLRGTIGYKFDTIPYVELSQVVQSNLILHYDFGDTACYSGTGTTITDLVGNTNATIYNATFSSNDSGYLSFNGTNAYVRMDNYLGSGILSAHTVAFYIRRSGSSGGWSRIFMNDAVNDSITITDATNPTTGQLLYRTIVNSGFGDILTTSGTLNSSWKYMVCSWDGSTMKVFEDTTMINSFGRTGTLDHPQVHLPVLGGEPGLGSWFLGDIAQLQIYDRALTTTEIQQNFDAHKARYGIT